MFLCSYPYVTSPTSSLDSCSPKRPSASRTEVAPALHLRLTHHFGAIGCTSALGSVLANLSDPFQDALWADRGEHTGVSEAGTRQQGSSAKASPLIPAWLAALEESLSTQPTQPSTPWLCISSQHPAAYLLDHLADCLPKGLFQSTPYSCTLVLMSRASESAWSMDGEGDTELDFEANIVDGFGSNSPLCLAAPGSRLNAANQKDAASHTGQQAERLGYGLNQYRGCSALSQ